MKRESIEAFTSGAGRVLDLGATRMRYPVLRLRGRDVPANQAARILSEMTAEDAYTANGDALRDAWRTVGDALRTVMGRGPEA